MVSLPTGVQLCPTAVIVDANFGASYRNPVNTYRFERDCRSKGVVEARLLGAPAS